MNFCRTQREDNDDLPKYRKCRQNYALEKQDMDVNRDRITPWAFRLYWNAVFQTLLLSKKWILLVVSKMGIYWATVKVTFFPLRGNVWGCCDPFVLFWSKACAHQVILMGWCLIHRNLSIESTFCKSFRPKNVIWYHWFVDVQFVSHLRHWFSIHLLCFDVNFFRYGSLKIQMGIWG